MINACWYCLFTSLIQIQNIALYENINWTVLSAVNKNNQLCETNLTVIDIIDLNSISYHWSLWFIRSHIHIGMSIAYLLNNGISIKYLQVISIHTNDKHSKKIWPENSIMFICSIFIIFSFHQNLIFLIN